MRPGIGFLIVLLSVFGGFLVAGGSLSAFWQPAEYIIIIGAAAGAMVVGNSTVVLKEIAHQAVGIFHSKKEAAQEVREILMLMHELLDARRKSVSALDDHVENPWGSSIFLPFEHVLNKPILVNFIADNLRMLSMGKAVSHEVESLLDKEILAIEQDLLKPSESLHSTGEAMPGFGILAAVGGIVITMGYLDSGVAQIGLKVAAALIGTFLGIFFCYCVLEPIAASMKENIHRQVTELECIKAILVSSIEGKSPLLCVDSGRRVIELDVKPSFSQMEKWIKEELDNRPG